MKSIVSCFQFGNMDALKNWLAGLLGLLTIQNGLIVPSLPLIPVSAWSQILIYHSPYIDFQCIIHNPVFETMDTISKMQADCSRNCNPNSSTRYKLKRVDID